MSQYFDKLNQALNECLEWQRGNIQLRTKTIDTQGDKVGKGKIEVTLTIKQLVEIVGSRLIDADVAKIVGDKLTERLGSLIELEDRIQTLELRCSYKEQSEEEDECSCVSICTKCQEEYEREEDTCNCSAKQVRLDIIDDKLKEILNQFEILKARVP